MERINEKLGGWLQLQGNTKVLLAKELGISPQTLNNRLQEKAAWKWSEACSVARLLNVDVSDLMN